MPFRRRFPLWALSAAVLATVAGGKLARRALVTRAPRPGNIHELCQLLQHSDPPWYVVPMSNAGEEAGVYLCVQPQEREHLQRLLRNTAFAHHWKGIVSCVRDGGRTLVPVEELNNWGEYEMRLGDLLFFGDPVLLDRIRKTVQQGSS